MGEGGSLSDPDALTGLRRLAEVVREAAAMPERTEPPKILNKRRPGWVGSMVVEVLKTATEPMTPIEITREIERQFGEPAVRTSVTYVLRSGRQTRANLIERVEPGRYRLAPHR